MKILTGVGHEIGNNLAQILNETHILLVPINMSIQDLALVKIELKALITTISVFRMII